MDLDAREEAAELREEPRQQRHSPAIELVGQAVDQNGMEAGVTEQYLDYTSGGWVFPENGIDLFPDGAQHAVSCLDGSGGEVDS
jgi:hypothetical protein